MSSVRILTVNNGHQSPLDVDFEQLKGQTIHKTLTIAEVGQGWVHLTVAPTIEDSATLVWNGLGQFYGIDFNISIVDMRLNFLSRLVTVLNEGDEITLQYK